MQKEWDGIHSSVKMMVRWLGGNLTRQTIRRRSALDQ
jgi:hypothetical protein